MAWAVAGRKQGRPAAVTGVWAGDDAAGPEERPAWGSLGPEDMVGKYKRGES